MLPRPLRSTLFPYTTLFRSTNQMFIRYNFGHDREENPDVQSLTGFSRGSSINPAIENTLLAAWFHQFSANTQNEADRKSTRLNSSHPSISYAVFCLKKKNIY